MTKLLGSLCVFAAGGMVWWSRRQERQKKRRLLSDLITALGRMETEIRLARIPLPRLLKRLAEGRGEETRAFFQDAFRGTGSRGDACCGLESCGGKTGTVQ